MSKVEVGRYLAYDEGCYECGEPSGVIGFFESEAEARAALDEAEERQQADWSGQHAWIVIDLERPDMSEWALAPLKEGP